MMIGINYSFSYWKSQFTYFVTVNHWCFTEKGSNMYLCIDYVLKKKVKRMMQTFIHWSTDVFWLVKKKIVYFFFSWEGQQKENYESHWCRLGFSKCGLTRPAVATLPGNWLQMQILGPHSKPTEIIYSGDRPSNLL